MKKNNIVFFLYIQKQYIRWNYYCLQKERKNFERRAKNAQALSTIRKIFSQVSYRFHALATITDRNFVPLEVEAIEKLQVQYDSMLSYLTFKDLYMRLAGHKSSTRQRR